MGGIVLEPTVSRKLASLKAKTTGRKSEDRAEFVKFMITHNLLTHLKAGELAEFGLSYRDMDRCFEMGDSAEVMFLLAEHGLADPNGDFANRVNEELGQGTWDLWFEKYTELMAQGDLFSGDYSNVCIRKYC